MFLYEGRSNQWQLSTDESYAQTAFYLLKSEY